MSEKTKAEMADRISELRDSINANRIANGEPRTFLELDRRVLLKEPVTALKAMIKLYESLESR